VFSGHQYERKKKAVVMVQDTDQDPIFNKDVPHLSLLFLVVIYYQCAREGIKK
jgi:hypothetical protein